MNRKRNIPTKDLCFLSFLTLTQQIETLSQINHHPKIQSCHFPRSNNVVKASSSSFSSDKTSFINKRLTYIRPDISKKAHAFFTSLLTRIQQFKSFFFEENQKKSQQGNLRAFLVKLISDLYEATSIAQQFWKNVPISLDNELHTSVIDFESLRTKIDTLQELIHKFKIKGVEKKMPICLDRNLKNLSDNLTRPSTAHPSNFHPTPRLEIIKKGVFNRKFHRKHLSENDKIQFQEQNQIRCQTAKPGNRSTLYQYQKKRRKASIKSIQNEEMITFNDQGLKKEEKLQKKSILKLQKSKFEESEKSHLIKKKVIIDAEDVEEFPQTSSQDLIQSKSNKMVEFQNGANFRKNHKYKTSYLERRNSRKNLQSQKSLVHKSAGKIERPQFSKSDHFPRNSKKLQNSRLRSSEMGSNQKLKRKITGKNTKIFQNGDLTENKNLESQKFIRSNYIRKTKPKSRKNKKNKVSFKYDDEDWNDLLEEKENDKIDLEAIRKSLNQTFYIKYKQVQPLRDDQHKLMVCSQMNIISEEDLSDNNSVSRRLNRSDFFLNEKFVKYNRRLNSYQNPRKTVNFRSKGWNTIISGYRRHLREMKQLKKDFQVFRMIKGPELEQVSTFFMEENILKMKQNQKMQRYLNSQKTQSEKNKNLILRESTSNCKKEYILEMQRRFVFSNEQKILKQNKHSCMNEDLAQKQLNKKVSDFIES